MADEMYLRKVLELQSEFLKRLEFHEPPQSPVVPSLLSNILEYDDEIIQASLGDFGKKLKGFASDVDFSHPGLAGVFDGALADDQEFPQDCLELLLLARLAHDHKLNRILPRLGQYIVKDSRPLIKKIESNRMHVRLLKDKQEREEIRCLKRMQSIDLQGVYKKGEDAWNAQPDNFNRFLRFDTAYQDELNKAEKKAKRYEDLGCTAMASEIRRTIEMFKENIEQSYFGFNRITMTNAAIILAKSLGFTFIPPQTAMYPVSSPDALQGKITVSRKFFGKYNFDPEVTALEFSPYISEIAGSPVFQRKPMPSFHYEPRVYPLHDLWDIAPENVVKTIGLLEEFPDAAGKPIFDHFGVIVPSVNFPTPGRGKSFTFLDEQGMVQSFPLRELAVAALDRILIRGSYIFPIIVGEKDGKCYFICYFN